MDPITAGSKKKAEGVEDMHLKLSAKYQTFRDLADRCQINITKMDKGDNRVFYIEPDNILLKEPRL